MHRLILPRALVRAYRLLRWLVVGLFIGAAFMAAMIQAAHAQFVITHERDESVPAAVAWVPVAGQSEGATEGAACVAATVDVSVFDGVVWGAVTEVAGGICYRQINGTGSFPFALIAPTGGGAGPVCVTALECAQLQAQATQDLATRVGELVAAQAGSPLALSMEEGGLIGGAILLLWGAAFGLRMLRRALDV